MQLSVIQSEVGRVTERSLEVVREGRSVTEFWPAQKEEQMKLTKNMGMLLLAIWLILTGLIGLFGLSFNGLSTLMGALAIVAGVLILVGR